MQALRPAEAARRARCGWSCTAAPTRTTPRPSPRRAEGVVRQARGALARPCGGRARGVAARRHLRAAGAQPRGHAARAAGGGGLRAAAGRHRRAGLPPLRARRRGRLRRAAGGRRARSPSAASAWRAIPSCAGAWARRRACACCTASPRRTSRNRCARPTVDARRRARAALALPANAHSKPKLLRPTPHHHLAQLPRVWQTGSFAQGLAWL